MSGLPSSARCKVCQGPAGEWWWLPGGRYAGESHVRFEPTLYFPGWLGVMAVRVCDECKARIEAHEPVVFLYRTIAYRCDGDGKLTQVIDRRGSERRGT